MPEASNEIIEKIKLKSAGNIVDIALEVQVSQKVLLRNCIIPFNLSIGIGSFHCQPLVEVMPNKSAESGLGLKEMFPWIQITKIIHPTTCKADFPIMLGEGGQANEQKQQDRKSFHT